MTTSREPVAFEPSPSIPHLLLLAQPSVEERRQAAAQLREQGILVVSQYGEVAIEIRATREEAERIAEAPQFAARLSRAAGAEGMERLTPEQREVVEQWNTRFSEEYVRLSRDRTHVGASWGGGDGRDEPAPYTELDPDDFIERLRRFNVQPPAPPAGTTAEPPRVLQGEEFARFERELARRYQSETLAYHLARLAWHLGPASYETMHHLPGALVDELSGVLHEAPCWMMTGEISVGIVFVESGKSGGPTWGDTRRQQLRQEILDGHAWLTSQHPTGDLSWVYDFQQVTIDVDNLPDQPWWSDKEISWKLKEAYWRDPAMARVKYHGYTYAGEWASVARYRENMRVRNSSAHAIVVFVTAYNNWWYANAGGRRLTLANRGDWGGFGQSTLDAITAHETCHLFGAPDEYTGSGSPCPSCGGAFGCHEIRNGNCGACAAEHQTCVMNKNSRRVCPWTRAHLGWTHLFVELTTYNDSLGGTNDPVWLDIGDKTFVLDTPGHDDREQGNVDGYAIYAPTLTESDFKRVLIRKGSDGNFGGWKLKRVRVWLHGKLLCDRNDINRWLENQTRWWVGCVNDTTLVNKLRVEVSTADVLLAGTDDDVSITMGGHTWQLDRQVHNDFERGDTGSYELDPRTGLYAAQLTSVKIHKSPDGTAGGWKLKGIRIFVNDAEVFSNQGINKWLENSDRTWSSSF
jgi:hypothetical protein